MIVIPLEWCEIIQEGEIAMKIQCLDSNTKRPLGNFTLQVQVKGKDSGYLTFTTDAKGFFELDNKYKGQQLAYLNQGMVAGPWVNANEGVMFYINGKTVTNKDKTTTQTYK